MNDMTDAHIEALARKIATEVVAEQMPVLAEVSAKRAIEMVTAEVGMSILKKVGYILGLGVVALAGWLFSKGFWQ
jgi:hypothetical protein